ncbi:fimbrial protein [Stenotrophomonas sp. NRRL B-14846]|uniref:fimbrial protein n=1 Tax=Stenotrophomonas sp. NRRL B-14846 TaxID=3162882 RepID=UPI003D27B5F6
MHDIDKVAACISRTLLAIVLLASPWLARGACFRDAYGYSEFQAASGVRLAVRGVPVGDALSPWLDTGRIYSPVSDLVCNSAPDDIEFGLEGAAGPVSTYTEAGISYGVYATNAAGVGVVVRASPISHSGKGGGFSAAHRQILISGTGVTGNLLTVVQLKFIRTGETVAGGELRRFQIGRFYARHSGIQFAYKPAYIAAVAFDVMDEPSCRVITRMVSMGYVTRDRFAGPGTVLDAVPYSVDLDCEAGVGQVDYQISPGSPVVDEKLGIAEVTGGASGVGIQFLDDKESPLAFYRNHEFGDMSTGRSSRLFHARYRQVGPEVTAGGANASLTFVFSYP